jgi:hypothetical protein
MGKLHTYNCNYLPHSPHSGFHIAHIVTDDIFIQPNQPLSVVPIIISSIVPTLLAGVVFYFIEKYTNNGFNIFRVLAIVLLVLSFTSPFTQIPGVTMAYAIGLNVLHVVVVAALLYFLNAARPASGK